MMQTPPMRDMVTAVWTARLVLRRSWAPKYCAMMTLPPTESPQKMLSRRPMIGEVTPTAPSDCADPKRPMTMRSAMLKPSCSRPERRTGTPKRTICQ